jgi:hypothetical protein
MRISRITILFLAPITIILSAHAVTLGCLCRTNGTVLDEFEESNLVVVGRVISVDATKAIMVVERAFKGGAKAGDQLTFIQSQFGDCVIGFGSDTVGESYLLYLDKPSKIAGAEPIYEASLCSRSNKLSLAFEDMAYFDKINEVRGKTRLSGFIRTIEANRPNFGGLVIKIEGQKKKYSVITDTNGFFEIYDLPAGDYVIDPEIPMGWHIDSQYMFGIDKPLASNRYQVTVKPKRHTITRITVIQQPTTEKPAAYFSDRRSSCRTVL